MGRDNRFVVRETSTFDPNDAGTPLAAIRHVYYVRCTQLTATPYINYISILQVTTKWKWSFKHSM